MKVICRRTTDANGEPSNPADDPWVRVGKEYLVLSIQVQAPLRIWIRLLSEFGQVVMFRLDDFEVSDPAIPAVWEIEVLQEYVAFALPRWHDADFWERVYDNDSQTLADLQADIALLQQA